MAAIENRKKKKSVAEGTYMRRLWLRGGYSFFQQFEGHFHYKPKSKSI